MKFFIFILKRPIREGIKNTYSCGRVKGQWGSYKSRISKGPSPVQLILNSGPLGPMSESTWSYVWVPSPVQLILNSGPLGPMPEYQVQSNWSLILVHLVLCLSTKSSPFNTTDFYKIHTDYSLTFSESGNQNWTGSELDLIISAIYILIMIIILCMLLLTIIFLV